MEKESITKIKNVYKEILSYLYNELCDNKMTNAVYRRIKSDVQIKNNEPQKLKFILNNFFEESVLFTFTFEKNVKDFFGFLISKNFKLRWQEISLGQIDKKEYIDECKKEIYESVIQEFIYYMKNTLSIDFDDIIAISSMYYEGAEANGNIYFFLDNTELKPIEILNQSKNMTKMCHDDIRKIRKNLEITYDEEVAKKENPIGLAFVYKENEWVYQGIVSNVEKDVNFLRFHFSKHMVWDLYENDRPVISYKCGNYLKPKENYEKKLEDAMRKAFNKNITLKIKKIMNEAIKQRHGTIVVILDKKNNQAQTEVDRLIKESVGTSVKEIKADVTFIRRLTSVDGALVIDSDGKILAYGVILDSKIKNDTNSTNKYNLGRGSRFTSAIKYIESLKSSNKQGIVIIISEDGMVNIYSTKDEL